MHSDTTLYSSQPLVTVVTPSFNSADTIARTIQSIHEQTYPFIEHIVMDGGSTDGTVEVAKRYEPRTKVISQPDRGQSDAINKGWRMAKGNILAWLNADDQYFPDTVLQAVIYLNEHPEAMWTYGLEVPVNARGMSFPFRRSTDVWNYLKLIEQGCYISQPTVFIRREVIIDFGYLREDLHYVMDYEYWLRIGLKYPGHFTTKVRASTIRTRRMKTESGGLNRIKEIITLVHHYGAGSVPESEKKRYVMGYIDQSVRLLRRGQFSLAWASLKQIRRYPKFIVGGAAKYLMYELMSEEIEGQIRRFFIRSKT